MYDIEQDVENVARAIYTRRNGKWDYNAWRSDPRIAEVYKNDARAALSASSAVAELKEL